MHFFGEQTVCRTLIGAHVRVTDFLSFVSFASFVRFVVKSRGDQNGSAFVSGVGRLASAQKVGERQAAAAVAVGGLGQKQLRRRECVAEGVVRLVAG